jgi:hypothetical protein
MKNLLLTILIISMSLTVCVFADEQQTEKLRVYIEGHMVDFNYIRNNTPFVDFVNEPSVSDVHLIINSQHTGGGGHRFSLAFYNKSIPNMADYKLTCHTLSFETQELVRQKLLATIKAGLFPFVNEKSGVSQLLISEKLAAEDDEPQETNVDDPWKNWVFRIGAEGGLNGEEQRKNYNYEISLRAKKITEDWKITSEYDYERHESDISKINDDVVTHIKTSQIEQDADIETVFSIDQHWSWGAALQGTQSTYRNNRMALEFMPALEYNVYPWDELDRRSLTVGWYVGPAYNEYYETTILGKTSEFLWKQSLEIKFFRVETWGETELWLEAGHYLPDFDYYSVEAGIDLAFRISKGLSFTINFQTESIQDQLYLPASELSDEELLLNTRKLPTTFEYSGSIGIQFQFGSIYNNVVNERL